MTSAAEFFKSHPCGRQFTALELPDIVHLKLRGTPTVEEARQINEAHREYAQDVEYFFFLVDLSQLVDMPPAIRKEASQTVTLLPVRGTVVCQAQMRALVLAKLLLTASNLFRRGPQSNPFVFRDTEEEARQWIAQRRQQIGVAAA